MVTKKHLNNGINLDLGGKEAVKFWKLCFANMTSSLHPLESPPGTRLWGVEVVEGNSWGR